MTKKVAILGGGIAGLSAAHELVERGFEVDVYERRAIFGGKARSMPVEGTATGDRSPLPGEHGFRFFPSFYRHLKDTMKRIPYAGNEDGVFDNLIATTQVLIARADATEVTLPSELPDSLDEWTAILGAWFGNDLDIPPDEMNFFVDKMLTILTSCQERRDLEYDHISWWDFIEADGKSDAYKDFLGRGITRSLVAMQAEVSSARTIGNVYLQMMLGLAAPWLDVDSVLDGPTNDVWIDPWVEYLSQHGAAFHPETTIDAIECDGERITECLATGPNGGFSIDADYYIACLPVEVMLELMTPAIEEGAPSLRNLDRLQTNWMNGIQFYLDRDVELCHGHAIFVHSEWALTSVSQHQFWSEFDMSRYGDGTIDGIFSVCISDWNTPGILHRKPARECTPEEIKEEVWAQLAAHVNDGARRQLDEANIVAWHLDPAIDYPDPNNPSTAVNAEPLLINTVGSLQHRPEANTAISNFFVASDYVRTNTDLATMEAANEAARRAVNGILEQTVGDHDPCLVWELEEPVVFEPMKLYDRMRFKMGLPHSGA
ncbi:FAD-dependent oxidoreductase [Persicimonas caeni]|uniref:FAD-dependent oxidoreductase n=1 Tax=Persicimonas caeni TaxID=2292766 RepID=A0A4Y6PZF6_PERCE|nr:FAD-dependent oxidoreductase [Persicimonas caeni]QDG53706.1 FAD-dependent oxidoreductase [Persicimonas caeni]QED34927.1 FAD-dependent oxidoreductase [Persicimonas caeni]